MKSKSESETNKIKRLLEVELVFIQSLLSKGKDMVLRDLLSRVKRDSGDPHGVIPISSNSYFILMKHYNTHPNWSKGMYMVVTRSKTNVAGPKCEIVHGADKTIDPYL